MIHYCPNCGTVSHHEPGTFSWAVPCPECELVAQQCPHPPDPDAVGPFIAGRTRRPAETATADVDDLDGGVPLLLSPPAPDASS